MKRIVFPRWVGLCGMLVGLAMMLVGAHRGEIAAVFKKAINICLECIGVG